MPTTSANMGLSVPIASTGQTGTGDPGPGYASNISADLTILDLHDHSSGKGVQITPAGMNINADLSLASNNATNVRAARFTSQASALNGGSDVAEVYVKTGDLWYVSSAGLQVQITAGGAIATGPAGSNGANGLPGSFSGTVSSPTATWQPTGQFSGTYKVTSWVAPIALSSGTFTGVPAAYTVAANRATAVSVVANVIGYDGLAAIADVDLKGSFLAASGTTSVTGVGTFTTCYNQNSPQASGWKIYLVPTGTNISLMISVATGGLSGTVNFVSTMQITERGTP